MHRLQDHDERLDSVSAWEPDDFDPWRERKREQLDDGAVVPVERADDGDLAGEPLGQEGQAQQEAAVDAAVTAVEELEVHGVRRGAGREERIV